MEGIGSDMNGFSWFLIHKLANFRNCPEVLLLLLASRIRVAKAEVSQIPLRPP